MGTNGSLSAPALFLSLLITVTSCTRDGGSYTDPGRRVATAAKDTAGAADTGITGRPIYYICLRSRPVNPDVVRQCVAYVEKII